MCDQVRILVWRRRKQTSACAKARRFIKLDCLGTRHDHAFICGPISGDAVGKSRSYSWGRAGVIRGVGECCHLCRMPGKTPSDRCTMPEDEIGLHINHTTQLVRWADAGNPNPYCFLSLTSYTAGAGDCSASYDVRVLTDGRRTENCLRW